MIIVSEIGDEIYFSLGFFILKFKVLYLIFVKKSKISLSILGFGLINQILILCCLL